MMEFSRLEHVLKYNKRQDFIDALSLAPKYDGACYSIFAKFARTQFNYLQQLFVEIEQRQNNENTKNNNIEYIARTNKLREVFINRCQELFDIKKVN